VANDHLGACNIVAPFVDQTSRSAHIIALFHLSASVVRLIDTFAINDAPLSCVVDLQHGWPSILVWFFALDLICIVLV
jgi:hypothetical protein